jgi:hypothetical protein
MPCPGRVACRDVPPLRALFVYRRRKADAPRYNHYGKKISDDDRLILFLIAKTRCMGMCSEKNRKTNVIHRRV